MTTVQTAAQQALDALRVVYDDWESLSAGLLGGTADDFIKSLSSRFHIEALKKAFRATPDSASKDVLGMAIAKMENIIIDTGKEGEFEGEFAPIYDNARYWPLSLLRKVIGGTVTPTDIEQWYDERDAEDDDE